MKVIVFQDELRRNSRAYPYKILNHYQRHYQLIEIEEKYLHQLQEETKCVAYDFEIKLKGEQVQPLKSFKKTPFIIAYIGQKQKSKRVDAYYEMISHKMNFCKPGSPMHETQWISCYSKNQRIKSSDLIEMMGELVEIAKYLNRPLILYGDFEISNSYYRYRSLCLRIVNEQLNGAEAIFICKCPREEVYKYYSPSHANYEFYMEHTIYLNTDYEKIMEEAIQMMLEGKRQLDFKTLYHRREKRNGLYNSLLYQMIPPTQKIYVPLTIGAEGKTSYYGEMGINTVEIGPNYKMLFDEKEKLDAAADMLRTSVMTSYMLPIMTRGEQEEVSLEGPQVYKVIQKDSELKYKGKDIYVAMISHEGIDYTAPSLRGKDGRTRIKVMWEQTEGEEGIYYRDAQINEALQASNPQTIVPINDESGLNTRLANIIGGESENYHGIATECEFLFAKINTAPISLQEIYGGNPSSEAIQAPDLLIAMWKLQQQAISEGKPIIFYLPYYTNIDSHEGADVYSTLVDLLSVGSGYIVSAPTGEEADKNHHQTLYKGMAVEPNVNLVVAEEGQTIVGLLCEKYFSDLVVKLYPPGENTSVGELQNSGTFYYGPTEINADGSSLNLFNGTRRILFRFKNMVVGTWRIEVLSRGNKINQIDLWISQEALNRQVKLSPSSPFITAGTFANLSSTISVASYNQVDFVALRSSGRGYNWKGEVVPLCGSEGYAVTTVDGGSTWKTLSGTEVAASIIIGSMATLLEKWQKELGVETPNGRVMRTLLIQNLKQSPNANYPNPSQGYGVFDIETLPDLLMNPFS